MSKFTKIIALMLAVLFTLSLVACGGDKDENKDPTTAPAAQTDASDNVTTLSGETTTTVSTKKGDKKSGKTTTTTKKQNNNLVDTSKGVSQTYGLIQRTTNRAGNASKKFVKSLKGFTLKILYPWENIYGDKKCQVAAEESIKEVENLYGVKIKEEGQFNKYNENLASELSAKNCDNHIYYAQGGFFPSYFQKGYISDLTPAMREAGIDFNDPWYMSEAKGFLNIDGKQYGWLATEDECQAPGMILYNKKLLNQKRLADPAKLAEQGKWTWDVLEKYAKKYDNDKSVVGFGAADTVGVFYVLAQQFGTSLVKLSRGSTPASNIADPKIKAALTEYADWTVGKNAWCETFVGKSWTYAKTQFQQGKVALFYGGHDAIQGLKGTSTQKDIGVAPFPTKKSSKTYTGVASASFIAFIPIVYQKDASKILFIRNEYYRYNYRFIQRNFQYKWQTYFGKNTEAITNAANIKFAKKGNKISFNWVTVCESSDAGITSSTIINEVISGKATAAQAIASKKNALIKAYNEVWSGHKVTGNV